MSTAIIQVPTETIQAITAKRGDLLTQAQALTITNDKSYREAGELALGIAGVIKEIHAACDPVCDATHKAHKAACAMRSKLLDECAAPDKIVRAKLTAWDTEQQRKREQQEQEARDRARREAEERQLQQAIAAEERGDNRTAEFLMKAPIIPEAIEMPAAPRRLSGVAYVEKWTYEVKDEAAVPREFLMIDHTTLRKHVELHGESTKIAGVEVFKVKSARIGGRIAEPKPVASVSTEVEEVSENLWG